MDGLWIHCPPEVLHVSAVGSTIAAQDGWARPFGDFNHRWLNALFRPIRPIKDFLNGVWLGHPLHAAATDIPIGTLLLTVILDIAGQTAAADIALVADHPVHAARRAGRLRRLHRHGWHRPDAGHDPRHADGRGPAAPADLAGLRAAAGTDRTIPIALSIIGFLIVTASAYVAGDVVYVFGNMVSRHAFRGAGTKWIRLDTGEVTDLSTLPEATPTKAKAGINDLVLVRMGEQVQALHAVCAHAGGPLAAGHGRRRLRRVPVARLALPVDATGMSGAARRCTTSRRTRSGPRRAVATRSGARPAR